MQTVIAWKDKELKREKASVQQSIRQLTHKLEQTKQFVLDEPDPSIQSMFKNDLKVQENTLKIQAHQLTKVEEQLKINPQAILTYQDFLELFENLTNI